MVVLFNPDLKALWNKYFSKSRFEEDEEHDENENQGHDVRSPRIYCHHRLAAVYCDGRRHLHVAQLSRSFVP